MKRASLVVVFGLLSCLTACDKSEPSAPVDAPKAALPKPATLPAWSPEMPVWSVSRRARMLHADGKTALTNGQLETALGKLAEACQLDRSLADARLDLARVYARAGLGSVALDLLAPLATELPACGGCIESLQIAVADPSLATLWQSERGKGIASKVAGLALPWEEWGREVSHAMVEGDGKRMPHYIHPREPFTLTRSCPSCSNPSKREPEVRLLFGPRVGVKLASRFNTKDKRLMGTPLSVGTPAKRVGRCLRYPHPDPVPVGTAALSELCFRPIGKDRAALTRVSVVYGRTKADLAREPKPAAP